MDESACVGAPASFFFPDRETKREEDSAEALLAEWVPARYCNACPVRDECLAYALEIQADSGIWGGLTSAQRKEFSR